MKKLVVLAIAAILAGTYAMAALAAEESVKFVKGTAKIDADLSDFAKSGAKALTVKGDDYAADAKEVDGCAFDLYCMNDAKSIYFFFDVTAPVVDFNKTGGDIWNQTGLEIWIGNKQIGAALDPDDKKTPIFAWADSGTFTGAAYKKTAKGFVYEMAIDIATMAGQAPDYDVKPGSSFPISFGVDYLAEEGGNRTGQLYYPLGWSWGATETYATATLAK